LRALVHAGDLRSGDRIPASPRAGHDAWRAPHDGGEPYAELDPEGLIQGHVGRGTFIQETAMD